jgi:DNA-binding transcriptional LysR family regulator
LEENVRTSIDHNLLIALNALLEERHVTRAAQRVPMSQPAMSDCLSRLRRHYRDELLTRVGNHFELTPLALSLREPAAAALEMVNRTFAAQSGFEPHESDREFVLYASDYATTLMGAPLTRLFNEAAPHASLRLSTIVAIDPTEGEAHLRRSDGIILPRGFASGLPSVELFRDEWVCVVDRDHPKVGPVITLDELAGLPWVVTSDRGVGNPTLQHLRSRGIEPIVDVVIGNFHSVPFLIGGSERIAIMQRRLATRFVDIAGIRLLSLPYDSGPLVETLWWHPAHQTDPGQAWFRHIVQQAGAEVM